ncbi:4Fe-4S binding protein [bacterium]|nr:4Fe-4S binding protein [bacterium]MBU1985330.1 4Fe-4S binding protein [bacterium]
MAGYFRDLWIGVVTVLKGLWVTFAHLFQRRVTVQYPRETVPMFPRTRVTLVNHAEECGFCLSCKRVCPVNIFTIVGARADKDEDLGILPDGKPKKMHILEFKIDLSKCVYCGLCVDACDTKSLRWELPQEPSVFRRQELHKDFSDMTEEEKARVRTREEQRKKEKAAQAAAAKTKSTPDEPQSD